MRSGAGEVAAAFSAYSFWGMMVVAVGVSAWVFSGVDGWGAWAEDWALLGAIG